MVGANLNDRKRCEKQSTHDRLKLGNHNNGAGQTLSSRACGVTLTLYVQAACSEPVRQNTIIGAVTAAWRNALVALRAVEGSMGQPTLGHVKVREPNWFYYVGILAGAVKLDMSRHTGTRHTLNM